MNVISKIQDGGALRKREDISFGTKYLKLFRLGVVEHVSHPQFFRVSNLIQLLQVGPVIILKFRSPFIPVRKNPVSIGFFHFPGNDFQLHPFPLEIQLSLDPLISVPKRVADIIPDP